MTWSYKLPNQANKIDLGYHGCLGWDRQPQTTQHHPRQPSQLQKLQKLQKCIIADLQTCGIANVQTNLTFAIFRSRWHGNSFM